MTHPASSDHSITDNLTENAHSSIDRISKTAGKAEQNLRHTADDVEDRLTEVGQQAKIRSKEAWHLVRGFVQEKPMISLGLAFTAGTMLSAIFKHRS